jgi:hypothetical protein
LPASSKFFDGPDFSQGNSGRLISSAHYMAVQSADSLLD